LRALSPADKRPCRVIPGIAGAAQVDRDQDTLLTGGSSATILGIIKKRDRDKDGDQNKLIIWIDVRKLLEDISGVC